MACSALRLSPMPIVVLSVCLGCGPAGDLTEPSAADLALQEVLDEARAAVEAPGAILGVRFPGGIIRVWSSGLADREAERPLLPGDAYYLGSVSKTYTAALILMLAEAGRLALDDPLSRFLPEFPRAEEISLRQLLQHTSGLEDFYLYLYLRPDPEEMIEQVTREWTQAEMLALAARFGHRFEPGEDWAYSNTNYFLLGVVAERAAGASLAEAYRTWILDPLGLDLTWLTLYEPPRAPLSATGYLGAVEGWTHGALFGELGPTSILEPSNLEWGAGGLAATAEESLRFMAALVEGGLLTPESLEEMRSFIETPPLGVAGAAAPDEASAYGLGLVRIQRNGYEVVGHGGLFTGHTAGLWHLPRCGATVAIYLNRGFVGQRATLDRLAPAITGSGIEPGDCVRGHQGFSQP